MKEKRIKSLIKAPKRKEIKELLGFIAPIKREGNRRSKIKIIKNLS